MTAVLQQKRPTSNVERPTSNCPGRHAALTSVQLPTGSAFSSGEHRPLACSSRQLAANCHCSRWRGGCIQICALRKIAFGRLPNAAGWHPIRLSLPMNFTHLLVRRAFIGGPEEAPASAGLRAGSALPRKNGHVLLKSTLLRLNLPATCRRALE